MTQPPTSTSANPQTRKAFLYSVLVAAGAIAGGIACGRHGAGGSEADLPIEPGKLLPKPNLSSSPLLGILSKRRTDREYATKPLTPQLLSNLLWAAFGVNRPDGKLTAPQGHGWAYAEIYVFDDKGVYRFVPAKHDLELLQAKDLRAMTGVQSLAAEAPVSFVLVSDYRKFPEEADSERRALFSAATAGAIMQNIYAFCAEAGLKCGVRADIDVATLHQAMGLAPEQKILLAQSAGHPRTLAMLKSEVKAFLGRR